MSVIMECHDLTKSFNGLMALNGVNFSLGTGRIVGLLGPNGSGKTTLLKIANGLIQPTHGEILLDGKKPGPLNKLNVPGSAPLKTLSKGTKEKVQLILAMSRRAKIYFLDEPIGGVDPAARDYILDTIINNYSEDALVVISTHLISDVERMLDEALLINNGIIMAHRTVDDIRENEGKSVDEYFREVFKCWGSY